MAVATALEPKAFVSIHHNAAPDEAWPKPGTELTVDLDDTSIRIPIVGGVAAYRRATQSR